MSDQMRQKAKLSKKQIEALIRRIDALSKDDEASSNSSKDWESSDLDQQELELMERLKALRPPCAEDSPTADPDHDELEASMAKNWQAIAARIAASDSHDHEGAAPDPRSDDKKLGLLIRKPKRANRVYPALALLAMAAAALLFIRQREPGASIPTGDHWTNKGSEAGVASELRCEFALWSQAGASEPDDHQQVALSKPETLALVGYCDQDAYVHLRWNHQVLLNQKVVKHHRYQPVVGDLMSFPLPAEVGLFVTSKPLTDQTLLETQDVSGDRGGKMLGGEPVLWESSWHVVPKAEASQ